MLMRGLLLWVLVALPIRSDDYADSCRPRLLGLFAFCDRPDLIVVTKLCADLCRIGLFGLGGINDTAVFCL